jgi:Tc5 transposase DNA-binding domain
MIGAGDHASEGKFNSEGNKSDKNCVSIFPSTTVTIARTSHNAKNASRAKGSKSRKAPHGSQQTLNRRYTEQNVQEAIQLVQSGKITRNQASKQTQVPLSTLLGRLAGAATRSSAHEHQQCLTSAQEKQLSDYCRVRGWRSQPLTIASIRKTASDICGHTVGKNWIYEFQKRHPELHMRTSKKHESKRARGLNKTAVDSFYGILEEVARDFDIHPYDRYNIDEIGKQAGAGDLRRRVIVDADQKEAGVTANEDRSMVTVLKCIQSNGDRMTPHIIHASAVEDLEWTRDNPLKARYAYLGFFDAVTHNKIVFLILTMAGLIIRLPLSGYRRSSSQRHTQRNGANTDY